MVTQDSTLQGTMTPTSSGSTAAADPGTEAARKRRQSLRRGIIQLSERGLDEKMIRQKAYEKGGFEPGEINAVLAEYNQMKNSDFGTSSPSQSEKVSSADQIGANIDQASLSEDQRKGLGFGKRMKTSDDVISSLEDEVANKGTWEGLKQAIDEKQAGSTLTQRYVPENFQKFDQAQRDFVNANLRKESGAVISPEEFENARIQYFPIPGEPPSVVAQKRANRQQVIKNNLSGAGVDVNTIAFSKEDQKKESGKLVNEESVNSLGEPLVNEDGIKYTGFFEKVLDKAADITGVKKLGEGVGVSLFLNTKEGKEIQEKAASGDKIALETLQQILDEAPNAKELIGSAALTALNAVSGGLAGGVAKGIVEKVGTGAATGASYGAAAGLEENKNVEGIVKSTAAGAALGTAVSAAGGAVKYLSDKRLDKLPDSAKTAVGQIVQGKTKDVEPAIRVLSQVETKGIKKYSDLSTRLDDNMKALNTAMDDVLSSDKTSRTLDQLAETSTVGGKKVSENYVKKALDGLDELYSDSSDPKNAQRIKNLIEKSSTEGLTVKELNDIAKEYGTEFGNKAFGKTGEPRTSVNAVAYENVRKGVKDTLRNLLPDDKAKLIDKNLSEHINTKELVQKMEEKVNALSQKVSDRGLIEKVGRLTGKTVDVATGGFVKGALTSFIPSNVGKKVMNSLDLEKNLSKNLKLIEKADKLIGNETFVQSLKKKTGNLTLPILLNAVREFSDD